MWRLNTLKRNNKNVEKALFITEGTKRICCWREGFTEGLLINSNSARYFALKIPRIWQTLEQCAADVGVKFNLRLKVVCWVSGQVFLTCTFPCVHFRRPCLCRARGVRKAFKRFIFFRIITPHATHFNLKTAGKPRRQGAEELFVRFNV